MGREYNREETDLENKFYGEKLKEFFCLKKWASYNSSFIAEVRTERNNYIVDYYYADIMLAYLYLYLYIYISIYRDIHIERDRERENKFPHFC